MTNEEALAQIDPIIDSLLNRKERPEGHVVDTSALNACIALGRLLTQAQQEASSPTAEC